MARHPSPNPRIAIKVYLTTENMALLKLAAYSDLRGKPAHGASSDIVNQALELYFKERNQPKESQNVQS